MAASDRSPTTTGTISGALISGVSGSGMIYTVRSTQVVAPAPSAWM